MIVFAIGVLFSWPSFTVGGLVLSPAWLGFAPVALWYLTRGDLALGVACTLAVGLLVLLAQPLGRSGMASWLAWGAGLFAVGWAIQFAGHWYEGKKPAFVEDILGLIVAPLFITAEALFALGWGKALLAEIERRAGPTVLRDMAKIA